MLRGILSVRAGHSCCLRLNDRNPVTEEQDNNRTEDRCDEEGGDMGPELDHTGNSVLPRT